MKTKNIIMMVAPALLLVGSRIIAGQVISLQRGQTYALENGDVIACMENGISAPEVVTGECRLFITGVGVFNGTGQGPTQSEAKTHAERNAQDQCRQYVIQNNMTFLGGPGNNTPYDVCAPGPMNMYYLGCVGS